MMQKPKSGLKLLEDEVAQSPALKLAGASRAFNELLAVLRDYELRLQYLERAAQHLAKGRMVHVIQNSQD